MGREFELKFRATPQQLAALRQHFGDFETIAMETTYYDTPSGSLSRLHWTLRRRFENGKSVCTVKTPAAGGGRGEWETEQANVLDAVPELCKLGAPSELLSLVQDGVTEVCGARFTRLAATLEVPDATVELALDEGVLLGGGKELPFAVVEVERKAGSERAAEIYAQALAARFGLTPEPLSKVQRAMALAKGK